jgi:hypothetical protein
VVLLLFITLVAGVVPVEIVILVRGVKLLPLGAVGNEVGGVTALEVDFSKAIIFIPQI